MNINLIIPVLISMVILFTYFITVWHKWKDLPSLSESYYRLGKRGWIFQVVLAIAAIVLLPAMLELAASDITELLSFIMCGGLITVGVAAKFKSDFENNVHFGAALVCATSAISYTLILSLENIWTLGVSTYIALIFWIFKEQNIKHNKVILLEMIAFITLYLTLLTTYF